MLAAVSKKKPRARTERRERERAHEKLADASAKLARLEAGGASDRPIDVSSASQVEVQARSLRCTRCMGELRVVEHEAPVVDGRSLRVVRVICPACGTRRDVWFRVAPALPS
jgi:hypothetical protein